jgi:anti-sigma factor RsiW
MNCDEMLPLLDGYLDGELDLALSLETERHIAACAACAAALESRRQLSSLLRTTAPYYTAPAKLRARLRAKERPLPVPRLALAFASAFLILFLGWAVLQSLRPSGSDLIAREVEASHVRSLLANHLTDVTSTDQHTVKPWFSGKLDYSPPVRDLATQGFPLVGGRLDYLDRRPIAALVYRHRQHTINVFVWPGAKPDGPMTSTTQDGFNLVRWSQGGMQSWAISDLNPAELQQFARLLRQ